MIFSQNTFKKNSNLRRSMLFGSIGLAIALSIIFKVVAYRLASDLGESVELQTSNKQLVKFFNVLKEFTLPEGDSEQIKQTIEHNQLFRIFDPGLVALQIWVGTEKFDIRSHSATSLISKKLLDTQGVFTTSGKLDTELEKLSWSYNNDVQSGLSVLMIRKISHLNNTLEYFVNRLSITAFLIFLLAVWAAFIIYTIITKRFEDNNQKLNYLPIYDPLTGLKNRTVLLEYFARFLSHTRAANDDNKRAINGALMLIDLNKFKDVSDTSSQVLGDPFLCTLAAQIQPLLDEKHVLVYGENEFVLWIEGAGKETALALSEQILTRCSQVVPLVKNQFEVGASIGIALYPQHGADIDTLFKHADIAMYRAKRHRLGVKIYQPDTHAISKLQVHLSGQLNNALAHKQFTLLYQPKVSLPDGKIFGAEALVRWQHPTEGVLAPAVFIELIEQCGMVHCFTRFIIEEALIQISCWLKRGVTLCVSVNLSPYNLADDKLVTFIKTKLQLHNVPPELLELELTESATMIDIKTTIATFAKLRALGVKLSIDDFGTGMSSLSCLKQLDVDYVKIDRPFITNMLKDSRDELILQSLISMCHSLNKTIIAEGVETPLQAERLHNLGCLYAQGYYFGRPMKADELLDKINNYSIN
jgi:diguanylate cyclase (GGDEF)-like protein